MSSRDLYALDSERLLKLLYKCRWIASPDQKPGSRCIAELARKKKDYEAGDFTGSIKRILSGTGVWYDTAVLFVRVVLAGPQGAVTETSIDVARDWVKRLSDHAESRKGPPVKRAMDTVAALGGRVWERVLPPPPEGPQPGNVFRAMDDAIREFDAARDRDAVRRAAKGLYAKMGEVLEVYERATGGYRSEMTGGDSAASRREAGAATRLEMWSWRAEAEAKHADAIGCRAVAAKARELAGWCRYHYEVAAAIPELRQELERLEAGLRERGERYEEAIRALGGSECCSLAWRDLVEILGRVRDATGEAARRVGWQFRDEVAATVMEGPEGSGGLLAEELRKVAEDVRARLSSLCERV